ncbi:MAG: VWA domain-containing protein, partial [Pseudomonadales bacterium]
EQATDTAEHQLANTLKARQEWLRDRTRDYVEQQYLLFASNAGQQLREDVLRKARMSSLDALYYRDMQRLIQKMAKKLVSQHARRKRIYKKGQLNAGKTIRRNIPNDGILFNTYWKYKRKDRPKVYAICDVSGSVALYARFLLILLYSLHEVLPRLKAFAFSSHLGDVTETVEHYPVEQAIELINRQWGMGSTDYGAAWEDFADLHLADIDNRSTIIVLGDGRNNYGEPQIDILRDLYGRCQRLLWINPESKSLWGSGDSEMLRYSAYCHHVAECNTLGQLERIVSRLLRVTL